MVNITHTVFAELTEPILISLSTTMHWTLDIYLFWSVYMSTNTSLVSLSAIIYAFTVSMVIRKYLSIGLLWKS